MFPATTSKLLKPVLVSDIDRVWISYTGQRHGADHSLNRKDHNMKNILKNSIIGIVIALVIFALCGSLFEIVNHGKLILSQSNLTPEPYGYTKMLAACFVIGLGFGAPASIYDKENLPMWLRATIHMGIGIAILIVCSLIVGWIPRNAAAPAILGTLCFQLVLALALWSCFHLHYKNLSRKINEKIRK